MLHIKDIEAFARINEALNDDSGAGEADRTGKTDHDAAASGPAHPALVMAMLATGRLTLSDLPKTTETSAPWARMFRRS
ncbi:hypothetical protein [Azospirillum sp. TSO35-2]|uniref:hypothetical protein n=1 Tax=Azospirillum sp. TSO35-2 TaxID=716796 RepID=UPI000D61E0C7|nr:hypothetical protein [Azospirillum sp. TSO35-2]PWC32574.1 hypothetical protein TSO352_18110 [Azospirillum sp. TSO35-2]